MKKVTVSHVDAMIELVEDLKEKLEKEVEVEVVVPTTVPPTVAPTSVMPTVVPTTVLPTTVAPTTVAPTTVAPTTVAPTTVTPTTVAPTTVAPTTVAPTTVAPTTVAPTTVAPTPTVPSSWFPIYDPFILGDNCNFEKQTTCYWDVIKDDMVTRLYLAIRDAYPTKALAHTRVLALSGMTSLSLEMWHESLSRQVKSEAPIDTYFYSDMLLARGVDVALIPRLMELLQYTHPSRLVFVYGAFKRDGFKTMLDWMVNNANSTYFKNLQYFQVSEHNIQACINPEEANTLEDAILADLKKICEDKVNFPLLETINLDNNGYNEGGGTGISEFAMHLMQACPASTGVEVSASTRPSVSYTKMCGSVDNSYSYYDLDDEKERAQCRYTWNWELKSGEREYAPVGPFPNRQNMEYCDDEPATTSTPPIYPTPTVTLHSVGELNALDATVESIIVVGCNDESFTVLNLTRFVNLKVFEVDDYSFRYVNEVYLIGLSKLERVVIGYNSFYMYNYQAEDSNGRFYLKDCPQLRELQISSDSFGYYSLELKSELFLLLLMNRFTEIEITSIWL